MATQIPGPAAALNEAARLGTRVLNATGNLGGVRDGDVQIATTPKDLVWQQDKVSLYHYRPLAKQKIGIPVLICYGLIGRWTMTDLQEDRSLVRNLLHLGVDLYVVDWGNPSRADRYLRLDDYIVGYLDGCVAEIARRADVEKVNLLGVCEGGVFTTAFAALEPERVNTLTLTITPIDFHADTVENRPGHGFINARSRGIPRPFVSIAAYHFAEEGGVPTTPRPGATVTVGRGGSSVVRPRPDAGRSIRRGRHPTPPHPRFPRRLRVPSPTGPANGCLPGAFMGAVFNQMSPMRSLLKYNLDLLDVADDESKLLNWLRMEKWIADRPDHPGEAAKQWLKELYQQNQLVRSEWHLDGRRVDLSQIRMPVLNVFAKDDHIIPPATSRALGAKVGTSDYNELALPGGHVGVFVGGKSQKLFAPAVAAFLAKHDGTSA